jgi:hypothetical protein
MKQSVKQVLFWTPRILSVLYAIFISMFALDVFSAGYGFWGTIAALLIHLVPTGVILAVLAIAWRWEWLGGVLFIALGILYLVISWVGFPAWSVYVVISGPLFLIGMLFLINWLDRKQAPGKRLGV